MNKSDSLKDSNEELKKSVRRQESSQEIEDRHQDLLSHIKAVLYTHDLQGQLLSVNQETTEFLGYDKNSLLNMNIRNLLAPEVRHEFQTYLTEMKRQGNAKGLMLVQTAIGEKRILIYNNTLQTEGVATPTVQGIAYDITKYIQTERALRQVSGQLSVVLESLPIVCYISKAEEDYGATYITNNVKAITGFEQTDFTSKPSFWTNRIHPEDAPRIFANLPQIFEKGYHEHQYRWQVADGSYKWFYDYTRLMKSSDGKNYIIGMMQDITERKRAEEALLHAAQQWRTTFDGISDFVSLLDLDGKILRCNKAMKDFVGKPFDEIINHSCWEIILGTTTPIEDCPFLRMKETLHRETTILSVNDLWFNVSVDPIFDQASHLIGAVNIISDISKRKQSEEAAKRLSQENAIIAEIGRIISSTLNIDEVYERFAEEAHKLIPFDRIAASLINYEKNTVSVAYGSGGYVQDREVGDEFPLAGSAAEWVTKTRSGLLVQTEIEAEVARVPGLIRFFQVGYRSMIIVPLISKDIVIGLLFWGSTRPNSYTDYHLKLAENIGNQIAGAVANSRLFTELKRSEEALRQSEEITRTLFSISNAVNTTRDLNELYRSIHQSLGRIIDTTNFYIALYNKEEDSLHIPYFVDAVDDLATDYSNISSPNSNSHTAIVIKTGKPVLHTKEDFLKYLSERNLKPGMTLSKTWLGVPLKIKNEVIGAIVVHSHTNPNLYNEREVDILLSVSDQVALAIDRKRAEEALRRSEEEAKRLAQENAIVAEIGRIISSTLNIEEVYERFAEEVRKLIPFDRIALTTMNPDHRSGTMAYALGVEVKDRNQRAVFPLVGSFYEEIFSKRSGILVQTEDENELAERYPILLSTFRAGLRSMISVPLISKGQVIGVLHIRSLKPNAYTELDLKLAERVGNQIAGAIANAQLFIERKHAEEAAKRLSQENAIVAEIGQIISSTLNIEEVYEGFAEKVRKLIPFDRITINNINPKENTFIILYNVGMHVADREVGRPVPLANTATEWVMQNRSSLLILEENREEMLGRIPGLLPIFKAGFRSMMFIPLISKDQVIGTLALHTAKPNTYTEVDLKLAERVSNQIAGAIANAQLFVERKRTEEALQRSEEEATRLSQENAVMAEIGRIISSTLDINDVYERFAEKVHELIPLDRVSINIINHEEKTSTITYVNGFDVGDRRVGVVMPFAGTFTEGALRARSSLLIQAEDLQGIACSFPALSSSFQAGVRSMMAVPLISKDEVIGVLHIQSLKPNAYTESEVRLAERVSNQIAGAIANAQLFIERKRAEEKMRALEDQLRQAQKMEAIGRLAGGVAHDFNNLLTAIKGYSQISLVMLKEGDPLKENIEEIQKAANRAANLTKQLLVFSRSQILELKVFHLNTILQDLDKMLHRIISEDIELVYSLSNDLGQVKTDPTQMEQVILNLAINAKDAMSSGGKLTIETSNATLDESFADSHIGVKPGDYVMLSVSDTGMGMTPEIKERIFEPFFTTKEKGKGTGLGLSIVYGIVKQSGGSIWVYSELGLGTTFKVFLPRIEEDAESLRPTAVPTESLQGSETILVVEDEEIVRKLACKVLEKNGYRVLEASNGEEALYIVQKQNGNPIHLVVTDVVMPGMSGRQLVDRLVSLWPQTKVLYMSGYTNDVIVHHGVIDPGIAYIQKPFTPNDLILKVRTVLDGP